MLDKVAFQQAINTQFQRNETPTKIGVDTLIHQLAPQILGEDRAQVVSEASELLKERLFTHLPPEEASPWIDYFITRCATLQKEPKEPSALRVQMADGQLTLSEDELLFLRSHTDFFRHLETFKGTESAKNQLNFPNFTAIEFQTFLKALSDVESVINEEMPEEFFFKIFEMADFFQTPFLVQHCFKTFKADYLPEKIEKENLDALVNLYERIPSPHILHFMEPYFSSFISSIGTKEEFEAFLNTYGPYLTSLRLPHSSSDDWLSALSKCPSLQKLHISFGTKVTNQGLVHLSSLKSLTSLALGGLSIDDEGMGYLKTLKQLEFLTASSFERLNTKGFVDLTSLPALTQLDLRFCKRLNPETLKNLSHLKALKTLSLRGCQVTDDILPILGALPELKDLDLSFSSQVTDQGVKSLRSCKGLISLNLSRTGISGACFSDFNPEIQLKHLYLEMCDHLEATYLFHLQNFPLLETLTLSFCTTLGDEHLPLLNQLNKLSLLELTKTSITSTGLSQLNLPSLTSLMLTGCPNLKGLPQIPSFVALKELALAGSDVTDKGLEPLIYFKALTNLNISRCPKLTIKVLDVLTQLKTLKSLDISDCNIRPLHEALKTLKRALPEATIGVNPEAYRVM